jgi:hypothetical protein
MENLSGKNRSVAELIEDDLASDMTLVAFFDGIEFVHGDIEPRQTKLVRLNGHDHRVGGEGGGAHGRP